MPPSPGSAVGAAHGAPKEAVPGDGRHCERDGAGTLLPPHLGKGPRARAGLEAATPPAHCPAVAEECVSGSGCSRPVHEHGLPIAVSRTELPLGTDARHPRVPHLGCPTDGRCHRGSGRRGGSGSVFILQARAFAMLQLCRGGRGSQNLGPGGGDVSLRGPTLPLGAAGAVSAGLRSTLERGDAAMGQREDPGVLGGGGKMGKKKKARASPIFAKAAVSTFPRCRGSKVQMRSKFQSPLATSPRSMVSGTDPPPPHPPISPTRWPGAVRAAPLWPRCGRPVGRRRLEVNLPRDGAGCGRLWGFSSGPSQHRGLLAAR